MHPRRTFLVALLTATVSGCGGSDSGGGDPANTTSTWRLEAPLPTGYALNGVWGSRASDVWAVGDAGTIVHWNGAVWATRRQRDDEGPEGDLGEWRERRLGGRSRRDRPALERQRVDGGTSPT